LFTESRLCRAANHLPVPLSGSDESQRREPVPAAAFIELAAAVHLFHRVCEGKLAERVDRMDQLTKVLQACTYTTTVVSQLQELAQENAARLAQAGEAAAAKLSELMDAAASEVRSGYSQIGKNGGEGMGWEFVLNGGAFCIGSTRPLRSTVSSSFSAFLPSPPFQSPHHPITRPTNCLNILFYPTHQLPHYHPFTQPSTYRTITLNPIHQSGNHHP